MKKRTFKISILTLLLAFSVVLSASCTFLSEVTVCVHENVAAGDCKTPGTCVNCGEQVGRLGAHLYQEEIIPPDCTKGGYTEYKCVICGDTYRNRETDPTDHSYGEWIFSKQPTALEPGEMYKECSVCKLKVTEIVPAHEHILENVLAKAVTCTSDGWDAYERCIQCEYNTKVVIKATGHAWGAYTSNGDSTHTRVCEVDPTHVQTEICSGGSASGFDLPVCVFCNTEYDFTTRAGNSAYGYYALGTYDTYGEGMQQLYKDMVDVCEKFYYSNDDVAGDHGYYIIGEFNLANYSLNTDAGSAVWKVFYVSNPVYYWLDAKIVTRGDFLILTIADDYAKAADRRAADQAIADMTAECDALIEEGMTDLERAMTIAAYIVENMEYAYESDGTTPEDDMWAHCMAGFAMHELGVCEAYAKSFMYLCLLHDVDCIIGSGEAGEPHAWNYVKLGGEWYGADITWTDNSGDTAYFDFFGLSGADIFKDHTPHSSTVLSGDFIYAAPELADESIRLTALYKNNEYVGMYKSIDDVFAAMTDENGEYTVYLGFYSFYEGAPVHTIEAKTTPKVKKLTIKGRNETTEPGYLDNNSLIYMSGSLTLASDVVLEDVHIVTADGAGVCQINLAGHTLTLGGNSVYLDSKICGTEEKSTVVTTAVDLVYFNMGVDIYRLLIQNDGVVFGADSKLVYCPRNGLYTLDGANVDIEHYT